MRSKFITKGLHLPLHLVKPTSRWFVFIQIVFPQKPECLAEWGAKHPFAFGFQRGKYAAVQFCQAERRTNSGNAAAFGEKCADFSRCGVQLLPAGQSIPLCRNVCTFICRSSIEDISRQQSAEESITVLRHFGQCFQHWADKLSILLFSAVQHSTDDTGVLTVCFRSLRLRNQELCRHLVVFTLSKDLKLTRHNGRAGAHGTYNPKHNDRSFNLANSEHIDPERAKGNIYWDCFHGFRSALDPQDPDDLAATFSDVERQFYETHYTAFIESQNERNTKIRHTERNRSIPDLLSSRKTCPEETIYQLGTLDEHASAEDLLHLVTEFIEEFKAKFGEHVHVLDWALHLDESTPHIHERHVFDCENKYGEIAPQQEKALEALGFDLPDPDKPLSRRNNRKIAFDAACRKMLFEIAKRHGLELEEEAEYGNRKYLEKQDFILAKQKEQLAVQQNRLDELTLKVNDVETLIDEVSAVAYDKAVEVVTDVVRTETRKEDMRMIEDTKKWVLSPERKAPKTTREYAAHRLDTVLDRFLKTMQTTTARLQEKLLKPEVRQKGKEQVKEKARDSVLQLLNRLQAEQGQNKPTAQPRKQEGHSEI